MTKPTTNPKKKKHSMSLGKKILIGIGIFIVAGIIYDRLVEVKDPPEYIEWMKDEKNREKALNFINEKRAKLGLPPREELDVPGQEAAKDTSLSDEELKKLSVQELDELAGRNNDTRIVHILFGKLNKLVDERVEDELCTKTSIDDTRFVREISVPGQESESYCHSFLFRKEHLAKLPDLDQIEKDNSKILALVYEILGDGETTLETDEAKDAYVIAISFFYSDLNEIEVTLLENGQVVTKRLSK